MAYNATTTAATLAKDIQTVAAQILSARLALQNISYRVTATGIKWDGTVSGVTADADIQAMVNSLVAIINAIDAQQAALVKGASLNLP